MRKYLVIPAAAVLLLAGSAAALAANGSVSSQLDLQAGKAVSQAASTSSASFANLPGLAGLPVCAIGQVTVTVSVETDGARPVGLRVLVDDGATVQPGPVRLVPAGQHDSESFTFVASVGTFEANDNHVLDVQWRSPAGGTVTLERGSVVAQYQKGTHACLAGLKHPVLPFGYQARVAQRRGLRLKSGSVRVQIPPRVPHFRWSLGELADPSGPEPEALLVRIQGDQLEQAVPE